MFLSDVRHAVPCSPSSSIWPLSIPGLVFFLMQLELRRHPTNLAYIWSIASRPIVLKTSESIWQYPVFAFICDVSIHLEISATVVRSAPEELPKHGLKTNRQHDRSSCSHRNRCCCSDTIDDARPALRGQTSGVVLVGREPSHLVQSRQGGQEERSDVIGTIVECDTRKAGRPQSF